MSVQVRSVLSPRLPAALFALALVDASVGCLYSLYVHDGGRKDDLRRRRRHIPTALLTSSSTGSSQSRPRHSLHHQGHQLPVHHRRLHRQPTNQPRDRQDVGPDRPQRHHVSPVRLQLFRTHVNPCLKSFFRSGVFPEEFYDDDRSAAPSSFHTSSNLCPARFQNRTGPIRQIPIRHFQARGRHSSQEAPSRPVRSLRSSARLHRA